MSAQLTIALQLTVAPVIASSELFIAIEIGEPKSS